MNLDLWPIINGVITLKDSFLCHAENARSFTASDISIRYIDEGPANQNDPLDAYALISFILSNDSARPVSLRGITYQSSRGAVAFPCHNPQLEAISSPRYRNKFELLLDTQELAGGPALPVSVPAHSARRIAFLFHLTSPGTLDAMWELYSAVDRNQRKSSMPCKYGMSPKSQKEDALALVLGLEFQTGRLRRIAGKLVSAVSRRTTSAFYPVSFYPGMDSFVDF